MLFAATEASLKYSAPAVDETNELTPEQERLEVLFATTEASIKYSAPVEVKDLTEDENLSENETGIILAETTK
jgi:hypothetical protein